MPDDEEAVQQLARRRRHREEVEGDGCFAVVLEKGQPKLTRAAAAAEEDVDCGEEREGELKHEPTLVTWRKPA